MRNISIIFLVFAVVCSVSANPGTSKQHSLVLRQKRDTEVFGNTKKLIQVLAGNLREAADQALSAVGNFTSGIRDQVKLCREKLSTDLDKLRARVNETINNITDKFSDAGEAVRECVDAHRQEANNLFNETVARTVSCIDNRIDDINVLVNNLTTMANNAIQYSSKAVNDMKNCTEQNDGKILAIGSCLGRVAVRTEVKGAVFLTHSGLTLARVNLAVATLPAALEVCAGTRLVEAGLETAKIVMQIGGCSASNIFSTFFGN